MVADCCSYSKIGVGCKVDLIVPLLLVGLHYVVPITEKVGQKFASNNFVTHTHTHGTKSWLPGFYKTNLGKLAVLRG